MLIDLNQPEYINEYHSLYRSYFEYHGYENIIFFMIQNHMTDSEEYQEYFNNYIAKVTDYEIDKSVLLNKVKENNPDIKFNNWEVLFEKDAIRLD